MCFSFSSDCWPGCLPWPTRLRARGRARSRAAKIGPRPRPGEFSRQAASAGPGCSYPVLRAGPAKAVGLAGDARSDSCLNPDRRWNPFRGSAAAPTSQEQQKGMQITKPHFTSTHVPCAGRTTGGPCARRAARARAMAVAIARCSARALRPAGARLPTHGLATGRAALAGSSHLAQAPNVGTIAPPPVPGWGASQTRRFVW